MLHSPPGLGKTLTAETISEHSQRPLYVVTSGELTIEAATMEKQMQKIFRVGEKWRAIVLIDEADVMMSKRSAGTLETNAIVSVFLRLIEYYQGILFLTTNLIEAFDEAIFNRVHLIIKFPNLEPATRQTIWRNLLVSYSTSGALNTDNSWTPQVYEALGNIPINGRTIKNLLRTASCYAKAEKVPLAVRHLRVVMQTSLAEIDYGEAWGMFLAAVKSTEAVN
ncbi:P-loop containing nucleoside triphosphate hydrolase protein [Wilcoxina mikolae CBS 423.85]|nr:P-loop containing nucleoside triphosphate hydrolase protein [Wilcoxina mikolae CBS 423.85]